MTCALSVWKGHWILEVAKSLLILEKHSDSTFCNTYSHALLVFVCRRKCMFVTGAPWHDERASTRMPHCRLQRNNKQCHLSVCPHWGEGQAGGGPALISRTCFNPEPCQNQFVSLNLFEPRTLSEPWIWLKEPCQNPAGVERGPRVDGLHGSKISARTWPLLPLRTASATAETLHHGSWRHFDHSTTSTWPMAIWSCPKFLDLILLICFLTFFPKHPLFSFFGYQRTCT